MTTPTLTLGTVVGHANPELADWAGKITANRRGAWSRRRWEDLPEVWVTWTGGTSGDGSPLVDTKPGWFPADALTVKGECPDCARPAHYVFPGNDGPRGWDRGPGWWHDHRHDLMTCWAGKAAFEARRDAEGAHSVDCACAGLGVCDYWNTVPSGPRAE